MRTVNKADLAASFQKAVVDVLTEHTVHAAKEYNIRRGNGGRRCFQ